MDYCLVPLVQQIKTEYFVPGTEPKLHCVDKPPEKDEESEKDFQLEQI